MTLAQVCYRLSGALQIIALNRLYDMDKRLNINGGDDYKLLVQRFPHLADTYESIVAREKRTMQREEQAKTTAADLKARIKETEVGSALNFKLYGDD